MTIIQCMRIAYERQKVKAEFRAQKVYHNSQPRHKLILSFVFNFANGPIKIAEIKIKTLSWNYYLITLQILISYLMKCADPEQKMLSEGSKFEILTLFYCF